MTNWCVKIVHRFFFFHFFQVDVLTKNGDIVAASLWLKEVEDNKRLAVLEPVERSVGEVRKMKPYFSNLTYHRHLFSFCFELGAYVARTKNKVTRGNFKQKKIM